MTRPVRGVMCLLIVLVAAPGATAESPEALKKLKEKRLALLVKIHEATKQLAKQGSVPLDEERMTMVDVFAARLDLAEAKEDRIKACEDAVKYAEQWEKVVTDLVKAKVIATPADLLKAQAYVLETRIALEKVKLGKDKKSE